MNHVSSLQLCVFLDDAIAGTPDAQTARHLAQCAMCRSRYEAWCHVDDSLRELLGQVPDEYAMEQRTSWVEIAVAAERKGLPAPEFAELRIPLDSPPPQARSRPAPMPPAVQGPPPEFIPSPGFAHLFAPQPPPVKAPAPDPRFAQVPPPAPDPRPVQAPPPAAPIAQAAPVPTLPPRPTIKRPVLQGHPAQPGPPAPPSAKPPANVTAIPVYPTQPGPPAPPEPVAVASAAPEPSPAERKQGYAKMPRAPRKGFAAFVTRPGVWVALALVAGLATALPMGVRRFGIPEIKFDFRPPKEREADVRKTAADADEGSDIQATPKKSHGSTSHAHATPKNEDPDASIIFDLPALEPEDGEPDPGAVEPAPKKGSAPANHGDAAETKGDRPMIAGEVRNAQGVPIEGARVYLTVPPRMVRTDRRGHFAILCPPGKRTLRIEAPGRAPVTRTLQLGRERLETRFTLDPAN